MYLLCKRSLLHYTSWCTRHGCFPYFICLDTPLLLFSKRPRCDLGHRSASTFIPEISLGFER